MAPLARLRFAAGIVVAFVLLSGLALAVGARRKAAPPAPPPGPPPDVTLALTAPAPQGPWEVKLTNSGPLPVRIVADPRLYSFEITPPSGTLAPVPKPSRARRGHAPAPSLLGAVSCSLPTEMVPSTDTERTIVLVAGRSWTVSIDPRMFCFTAAQSAALVEGATVTATFGWTPNRAAPPYAITPVSTGEADAGAGPARSVSADPVKLTPPPPPDGGVEAGADAQVDGQAPLSDAYPIQLKVSLPERLDVSRVYEHTVTVWITNESDRPIRTLFTPNTIGFTVVTPRGTTAECGAPRQVTVLAELASTLRPRARTAVSLDLDAACPDVFRKPGLYRVRPRFDSTEATGDPGTNYFAGKAIGDPMLLRVREGDEPLPPPRVDPL